MKGRNNIAALDVSYVGVYSYSQDKYFGFFEKDLPVLEKILEKDRPEIIGYNTIKFDNPVLQAKMRRVKIADLPQMDIFKDVSEALGFRLKLNSLAEATLGEGKSGDGLDAIAYFRAGKYKELSDYCLQDVKVTKELYEYGARHDKLLYMGGGELREVPVSWGEYEKIKAQLEKSLKEHTQINISYLKINNEKPREIIEIKIEPQEIKENRLKAFSQADQETKVFDINRIIKIDETGSTFAHQRSLI
ncbi:MAG: ribonuclease H-like domain-containing protein [Patescibacteria group bacterium]